jgi:hypothetical protein
VIINRRGDIVEDVESIRAPQAGRDLALAIDARLQYLAFRELKTAVEANRAKAGGLVILDARTGEILALANWPTYNPNARNKVAREKMRNRALTDVFEPGSTLKPFTIAAALESGAVRPDTVIQTAPGSLTIGPNTIHDAHPNGALTVEQVIQKSSNVGAAKIALSLPPATMWHMLSEAGFGAAPNTGFPGEVGGRLRPAKTWKPIEQATMAYGHGISVNLVQLARAYTVFASDGELKPATLFKGGDLVAGRPVMRADTALAVRHMLELAVQPGGTAPKAQVPGTGSPERRAPHKLKAAAPSKVRVLVRGLCAGVRTAAHRRGDDRRTLDGRALRRRSRCPRVFRGDGLGAAHARRVARCARRQRDPARRGCGDPGGDVTVATLESGIDAAALLAQLPVPPRRVTADSRQVRAGDAFAAYPGQVSDGRAFIPDAIARGAGAVLWEALSFHWDAAWRVSNVAVEDLRAKLGAIADHIYGHPSRTLFVVGVTGTNGKTSCTHWIAQCLEACGRKSAILGTLGNGLVGALDPSARTTPDAAEVHATLGRLRDAGAAAVAMEVSSHGLEQGVSTQSSSTSRCSRT